MALINKKDAENNQASGKLRNKKALKYGGFSIALIAIVIAVAIVVNVFFSLLAERVNLDIDISLSGRNTLSQENIDYLKTVDKEVNIYVLSEKAYYQSYVSEIAEQYYQAQDTTGVYFEQTLTLLELYGVYSDKINVEFIDVQKPSANNILKDYSEYSVSPADILIECTHKIDGNEIKRTAVLSFEDIYYLTDETGYASYYGYYTVSGNNLETALTGAIYKVTSAETKKVLLMSTHCKPDSMSTFVELLKINNFDVDTQEGNVVTEISKDYDIVIISAPTEDFMVEELELINEWLYNSGERGKGVMFFASPASPELPILKGFLEEWGVGYDDGLLFETDGSNHTTNDPMTLFFTAVADESEYEGALTLRESAFTKLASGGNVPLFRIFETEGARSTYQIAINPKSTVVVAPMGTDFDWEPDAGLETDRYANMLLSVEEEYDEENVLHSSYIATFSSYDFANVEWLKSNGYGNSATLIKAAMLLSGAEETNISFKMKSEQIGTFYTAVTSETAFVLGIIFQIALPVLIIALGIFVYVRRSRR